MVPFKFGICVCLYCSRDKTRVSSCWESFIVSSFTYLRKQNMYNIYQLNHSLIQRLYTSTTDWEKPEAATLGNFMRAYIIIVACRHENVNLPCSSEIFHLNVVTISRTCKFSYLLKYGNSPFYLCVNLRPIGHKIAKFF